MKFLNIQSARRSVFFATAVAVVACLITQLPASAANTFPGTNLLVNVNSSGGGGQNISSPTSISSPQGISADGNMVLFQSTQTDLPGAGTIASTWRLYERNVSSGTTTRVDVSASGIGGNGGSSPGVMSETGRYVVFFSASTNLIDGSTMPAGEIYLKDMETGGITALLKNTSGTYISDNGVTAAGVSNDGRFVTFSTLNANNYIAGVRSGYRDVLLLDVSSGVVTMLDAPVTGSLQNVHTYGGGMTCDGALIVFQSSATNLVSGFSGSGTHVYIVDLRNGLKLTDLTSGTTGNSTGPSISCNGRYITFQTTDRTFVNPTPTGMNSNPHLVEYNRITGASSYIDSDSSGSFSKTASPVSYVADTGDMLLNVPWVSGSSTYNVLYLKHVSDGSGTLEDVEKTASGSYLTYINAPSSGAYLSANGKYVVYPTREAYGLGLTSSDSCNGSSGSGPYCDTVRSVTGL